LKVDSTGTIAQIMLIQLNFLLISYPLTTVLLKVSLLLRNGSMVLLTLSHYNHQQFFMLPQLPEGRSPEVACS